jgi:predicted transcriptional regulator
MKTNLINRVKDLLEAEGVMDECIQLIFFIIFKSKNEGAKVADIKEKTGSEHKKVMAAIRELSENGMIMPIKDGKQNKYIVAEGMKRAVKESKPSVADILKEPIVEENPPVLIDSVEYVLLVNPSKNFSDVQNVTLPLTGTLIPNTQFVKMLKEGIEKLPEMALRFELNSVFVKVTTFKLGTESTSMEEVLTTEEDYEE